MPSPEPDTSIALAPVSSSRTEFWQHVKALVLDSVSSEHSRRAYRKSLDEFDNWCAQQSTVGFNKATVQKYRVYLEQRGLSASTINVRLSAVRKLAVELADAAYIAPELASAIGRVKGAKRQGTRSGNWLTRREAEHMLSLPDRMTNKGKRDRALLCLLLGCGLRREELANLEVGHIQQREARWVLVDLIGKGQRVRTVPMTSWTKVAIDQWLASAAITSGRLLRAVNKGDRVTGDGMTAQAIFKIVVEYGKQIGVAIAPHDLRRTFAKLAHTGHAPVEQIQISLGHASVATTERYLNVDQDLTDAPCDHLGLRV